MADNIATDDTTMQRRLVYLKVIYFVCLVISLLYIVRFNFEYQIPDYNVPLIIMWILSVFLPPAFLYRNKSYTAAASTVFVMCSALLIYFLYISGGVDAPGIFWLAAIPLIAAFLLGGHGALLGYIVTFVTLIVFGYFKVRGTAPTLVLSKINYGYEKLYNIIMFLALAAYLSHFYLQQSKADKNKKENREKDQP
jgi:hypothetical protein